MGGWWVKTGTRLRFDILLGLSTDVRLEGGERRWGEGVCGWKLVYMWDGGGGRWGRWGRRGVWVETGIHVGWGGGGDGKRKNG